MMYVSAQYRLLNNENRDFVTALFCQLWFINSSITVNIYTSLFITLVKNKKNILYKHNKKIQIYINIYILM